MAGVAGRRSPVQPWSERGQVCPGLLQQPQETHTSPDADLAVFHECPGTARS